MCALSLPLRFYQSLRSGQGSKVLFTQVNGGLLLSPHRVRTRFELGSHALRRSHWWSGCWRRWPRFASEGARAMPGPWISTALLRWASGWADDRPCGQGRVAFSVHLRLAGEGVRRWCSVVRMMSATGGGGRALKSLPSFPWPAFRLRGVFPLHHTLGWLRFPARAVWLVACAMMRGPAGWSQPWLSGGAAVAPAALPLGQPEQSGAGSAEP